MEPTIPDLFENCKNTFESTHAGVWSTYQAAYAACNGNSECQLTAARAFVNNVRTASEAYMDCLEDCLEG